MGLFSKLALGGLGWALGGPIGAIVGVFIASAFGNNNQSQTQNQASSHTKSKTTRNDFIVSLLVLQAAVMKADGNVKRSELDVVKAYLRKLFDEQTTLEALQLLRNLLEKPINTTLVANQIAQNMSISARRELLTMLFDIAYADGQCVPAELATIEQIAVQLRLTKADFNSIQAMFGTTKNPNWAYEILDITPNATDDEVKKAFRRKAMQYHPDRVGSLGEEIAQNAAEKFRKVHEAYEHIKQERGIK